MQKSFGSDNHSGVDPRIMAALTEANTGHVPGYGGDFLTQSAADCFKSHFGVQCEVFFVFNGTGANVLSIQACCQSYQAVISSTDAHIHTDECGAAEKFTGCKILAVPTADSKIYPTDILKLTQNIMDRHHVQPRLVSLTQATELGLVYSPQELLELTTTAKRQGLLVHMDGARLSNAAAHLGCSLRELTTDVGIDILSFGGTKNGLMHGEAVVVLNPALVKNVHYFQKQALQLPSKMRFISAQFLAYLKQNIWYDNALHANSMAALIAKKLAALPMIKIVHPVACNEVFVSVPEHVYRPLQDKWHFYVWDHDQHIVRLVTSFDTTAQEVEQFVDDVGVLIRG
jgi:threonine aldolase